MPNVPITVLHVCEHFGGRGSSLHGVARGFQWWLRKYDGSRFRVILCSRKGHDKAAEQMIQSGITPLYLGYGKFDLRNLFRLIRIVRKEKVDILHAHGYGSSLWANLAGLLLRKPVIIHERCNYKTVPLFQRPIELFFGPLTKHAFAVSESTKQFCIKHRYMKPDVIEVIYNGIPLEDITRMSDEWIAEKRKQHGAQPEDLVIGLVGRLEHYKGLGDTFEALKKVVQECPNTHLWIAGDGPCEEELREMVRDLDLEDHVRFLGFVPQIREDMQCFDIQLFPSHQEGTPNSLYEALAVGNAIVASTTDGQGEILKNEEKRPAI